MRTTYDDLIKLLTDAQAEADRLGPTARPIGRRLADALTEARSLGAGRDAPDEGKRPEELSSANDG
jgi:hypothetical protein